MSAIHIQNYSAAQTPFPAHPNMFYFLFKKNPCWRKSSLAWQSDRLPNTGWVDQACQPSLLSVAFIFCIVLCCLKKNSFPKQQLQISSKNSYVAQYTLLKIMQIMNILLILIYRGASKNVGPLTDQFLHPPNSWTVFGLSTQDLCTCSHSLHYYGTPGNLFWHNALCSLWRRRCD